MTTARSRRRSGGSPEAMASGAPSHHAARPRRAVGPVAPALQMKPAALGRAGDAFEQEADRAADQIVQGHTAAPVSAVTPQALQRQVADASAAVEEEPVVQRLAQAPAVAPEEIEANGGLVQALFDEEQEAEPVQARDGPAGPRTVDLPSPGAGSPLPTATRNALESGLGADLGGVRVHDDAAARETADRMGAKAFTHGQDISLGSGQSPHDVGLLAHEAAHVVQQAGGSGSVAQRQTPAPAPAAASAPAAGIPAVTQKDFKDGSSIDTGTSPRRVTLGSLSVPATKAEETAKHLPKDVLVGQPRDTKQSANWTKQLAEPARTAAVAKLNEPDVQATKDQKGQSYLVNPHAPEQPIIVDTDALAAMALRPTWDKSGVPTRFHVDHRVEYQLGGADEQWNYWLLEEQANMSSGSAIANLLAKGITDVFTRARAAGVVNVPEDAATARGGQWRYSVAALSKDPLKVEGREHSNWTDQEVAKGETVSKLRAMTGDEMKKAGGSPEKLVLFLGPRGGARAVVPWGDEAVGGSRKLPAGWWFHLGSRGTGKQHNNLELSDITFADGKGGTITGTLFKQRKKDKGGGIAERPAHLEIEARERVPWAGFVAKERFLNEARTQLTFPGMSPIELDEMDLTAEKGLVARGRLLPTIPLIDKAEIDVVIDGDDVYLSKIFTSDDFTFPSPIKVGDCSLELRFGTKGFQILGAAAFAIEGLGAGKVYAAAGASLDDVSFALGGEFDFLSDLFDPARVELWYKDQEFGGRGVLGIKEGKVKGLKSASVTVEWGKDGLAANGTFATTVPGVESGTLAFAYRADGTIELGGTLNLGSKVPGISSGSIEAQLTRNPEGGWKVFGRIAATPSIPGVASQVTGTYDDGTIQLETTVAYARGMAAGQFTIGLTNRPLDPAGRPAGEPGTDLSAYGGGQVALTLAPWLKATAGLRLLPSGEVEVSGEIGLPSALEVFPRKSLDKELFKIGIDIPIIGISVAGQNIGIFATIAGGAQLLAFFGPAELKDLSLGITWNPDHEENTTVVGHAALHLPAGAGVRLSISAALGAGIPVVEARLGLEIGGTLGIEAAIGAGVDIDWTPQRGLVLDAVASAYAEPVFTFDVTGFARVDLDLWLKTINLWEKKWALAAFQYGSGLRLGVSLPVHYEEGKPFAPSLSDVTFDVPDIDPKALLSGLVDRIT